MAASFILRPTVSAALCLRWFLQSQNMQLMHPNDVWFRAVRLIEIVIKSRFERARFLNRFIARFFPRPRPPAVCYPIQSECSAPKWSARTEQTGHKDVTPGSHILRLWCVCGVYFFSAHVNGSECSHCTRLQSGRALQEQCVCNCHAAIVSARSLFLLCCTRWIKVSDNALFAVKINMDWHGNVVSTP